MSQYVKQNRSPALQMTGLLGPSWGLLHGSFV